MQNSVEKVVGRDELDKAVDVIQRRLKALFALRGVPYADLGAPHGMSAGQVSSLLNGANPTLRTLMVMARVGGVRLEDLMREVS